jgi:limonene-1,2-epoxide hydrolase
VVFKLNSHFKSDNFVIINSTFESILPDEWFGNNANGKVFVSLPIVTILKFVGDKIISHTDYADYNTYKKQIQLQMKKK